ncbi:ATP-binding cassette domain-containing protein [Arcanobacterium pinnipediorum]|uniref:ATP-binding cassette domain-containing protein n=1 Tax=Arcanobacterium pinnipediorum TaxID=1503041 RepID=A0ABY5AJF7_9ACTO|nr:ATP-binding cassette domain-containing protein [Arcanobacterium pinnipediorum]USR79995.1 ATP-binding cassette domain-containing protein [Arcanobacterium pinnipediorum]
MKDFIEKNPLLTARYIVVSVLSAILETGIAFILAALAASITGHGTYSSMTVALFAVFYLIPLGLVDWRRALLVNRLSVRYMTQMRAEIIRTGVNASLPVDRGVVRSPRAFQSALINDAEMIAEDYAKSFFSVVQQAILLCAGLVGTALINVYFLPIVVLLSVCSLFLPKLAERRLRTSQAQLAESKGQLLNAVSVVSAGLESILSVRRSRRVEDLLISKNSELEGATNRRNDIRTFVWTLTWIFGLLIIIGVWSAGAIAAEYGWATIAEIVALAQLMTQVAGPFQEIAERYAQILGGHEQLTNVKTLLRPIFDADSAVTHVPQISDDFGLDVSGLNVRIDDKTLLHDVDLSIPAGARVLVRGASGCGKSTLLRALAGSVPTTGTVTYGDLVFDEFRSRAGVIVLATQESFIIPGTLAENLDPHADKPDRESIVSAFIPVLGPLAHHARHFPDTPAEKLSGGEKKRVHLLRTLLAEPPVLLADEITTGLDATSAVDVLRFVNSSHAQIVLSIVHDLPDTSHNLGFTHELTIHDGRVTQFVPVTV